MESLKSNLDVVEAEKKVAESNYLQAIELFEKALKTVGALPEIAYLYHRRAFCKLNLSNCDDALKETKIALQMCSGTDMEIEAINIHALRCMIYTELMGNTKDRNLHQNYSALYIEDFRKAIDILKTWKYLPPIQKLEFNHNISHPKAAILILHGYGADANDLHSGIGETIQKLLPEVRLIFPQGAFPLKKIPWIPFIGYSWYAEDVPRDTYAWYSHAARDLLPYAQIYKLMDELNLQGIKNEKVMLMGFSLGGTVSCITSILHCNNFPGGLICCSGGNFGAFPEPVIDLLLKQASSKVPVLIGAGTTDNKVDVKVMRRLHEIFKSQSFNVEYHEYVMGHQIISEQIRDIVSFVQTHVLK